MATIERIVDDEESVKTLNAKERIRGQLDSDIEAFLSRGGSITEVEVNVTADPPTKPVSKYGGRPI
tara:strand:- start:1417 stop:1614 length:198 start_codon:yes stop_codon:yes gene_type:complete